MGRMPDKVDRPELERRMDAFAEACRERGLANTHQRWVIYRALAQTTAHPSADEIFAQVRRDIPSVSLATVYKNLTTFREEGLVRAVHTEGDVVRFDANLEHHHHLVCRSCGRVEDVADRALDSIRIKPSLARGFTVEEHQVVFRGLCARCSPKS